MKIEYESRDNQNRLVTVQASDEATPCSANVYIDATIDSWDYPKDTVNIDCGDQGGIELDKNGLNQFIKILEEIERGMS
jgi:hypothetical protein